MAPRFPEDIGTAHKYGIPGHEEPFVRTVLVKGAVIHIHHDGSRDGVSGLVSNPDLPLLIAVGLNHVTEGHQFHIKLLFPVLDLE